MCSVILYFLYKYIIYQLFLKGILFLTVHAKVSYHEIIYNLQLDFTFTIFDSLIKDGLAIN